MGIASKRRTVHRYEKPWGMGQMGQKQDMTEHEGIEPDNGDEKAIISRIVTIIAVFVLISVLLAAQIYLYGALYEGVRSFVRGEGIWAKAQKDATYHLTSYSYTKDPLDYREFLERIAVTLGDKKARIALTQPTPDEEVARQGLLQGGNDPQDLDAMIGLILHFGDLFYIEEALQIWAEADGKVASLIDLGQRLDEAIKTGGADEQELSKLRRQIAFTSAELHAKEERFSAALSEGARWVRDMSWKISGTILIILIGTGILASRRIIRRIAWELKTRKELETRIFREAREDPLTNLFNRKFFDEQFDRYLRLAEREKRHCALLYLDLDGFKPVNDTYGHGVGDKVLKRAADIFSEQLRSTDLIARIGGDEFIVLLVHPCDREGVKVSANRIIEELKKPMTIDGADIVTGVSIGAAMFPEDGENKDVLVKKADMALYDAKNTGRGKLVFYDYSQTSKPAA